jgi:AcrR family transcriptional regulator
MQVLTYLKKVTMRPSSRKRIMSAALRLFGEHGFAATTVAQIEREAGLSGGSGALYRHFRSKDELLVAAVQARLTDRDRWSRFLEPDFSITALLGTPPAGASLVYKLTTLCRIGLARLEHDRDVTRILLRDNTIAPEVLEVFRREEFAVVTAVVARALSELAPPQSGNEDWNATAAVLVGAIAHYWLMSDIFDGNHPADVGVDRYLEATAELTAARLGYRKTQSRRESR